MSGSRSDVEAERYFAYWGSDQARARLKKRRFHEERALRSRRWDEVLAAGDVEAAVKAIEPGAEGYASRLRDVGFEFLSRRLNRPAEGLPYLHRSLALDPGDPDTWTAMETACRQLGHPFEAAKPQGDPYTEGMEAYGAGAYARAWSLLVRTPRWNLEYAKALRFVGFNIFAREWKRPREGIPYLDLAYDAAPGDPKVLADITRAYEEAGLRFDK